MTRGGMISRPLSRARVRRRREASQAAPRLPRACPGVGKVRLRTPRRHVRENGTASTEPIQGAQATVSAGVKLCVLAEQKLGSGSRYQAW